MFRIIPTVGVMLGFKAKQAEIKQTCLCLQDIAPAVIVASVTTNYYFIYRVCEFVTISQSMDGDAMCTGKLGSESSDP